MRVLSNAELTQRLEKLEQSFFASRSREVDNTYRSEDALNKADALTPYTETKTAYFNEKEKTFYDVPSGNVTVLFDNYNGNYSVSRVADRVTVSFDTLTEQTNITISIK